VAILTTFAVLLLKPSKPEIAALVSVAGGIIILFMFVEGLGGILHNITAIVSRTGINSGVFGALL